MHFEITFHHSPVEATKHNQLSIMIIIFFNYFILPILSILFCLIDPLLAPPPPFNNFCISQLTCLNVKSTWCLLLTRVGSWIFIWYKEKGRRRHNITGKGRRTWMIYFIIERWISTVIQNWYCCCMSQHLITWSTIYNLFKNNNNHLLLLLL